MNEELPGEKFSDDPEEQLRIENDILKLKIQAELGGDFEGEEDLPPDVENLFLKNVLEFEHKQAMAPVKTLFENLGKPTFVDAGELTDTDIEVSLANLEKLMEEKGIVVDYETDYPARTKYKFITEELFEKEAPVIDMPGLTMHYIYEEYHPNHTAELEKIADIFYSHWVERSFQETNEEIASELILENGAMLSGGELLQKMKLIFDSYEYFDNSTYRIETVSFEIHDDGTGLGYVEGHAEYDAILETGEVQQYKGPFKLYAQYDAAWSIFFFQWPGFKW